MLRTNKNSNLFAGVTLIVYSTSRLQGQTGVSAQYISLYTFGIYRTQFTGRYFRADTSVRPYGALFIRTVSLFRPTTVGADTPVCPTH